MRVAELSSQSWSLAIGEKWILYALAQFIPVLLQQNTIAKYIKWLSSSHSPETGLLRGEVERRAKIRHDPTFLDEGEPE